MIKKRVSNLCHPFRGFRMRTSSGMFINFLSGYSSKERHEVFRQGVVCGIVFFIRVNRSQGGWGHRGRKMNFAYGANEGDNFNTMRKLEILFSDRSSCHTAYRMELNR